MKPFNRLIFFIFMLGILPLHNAFGNDALILDSLVDSIAFYRNKDKSVCKSKIEELLEKSADDKFYQGIALAEKAFYFFSQTKYDSSTLYINQSKRLAEQVQSDSLFYAVYNFESLILLETNKYAEAIKSCKKMTEYGAQLTDKDLARVGHHHLARIYLRCKIFDESKKHFLLSQPNIEELDELLGWWYLNMGEYYLAVDDYAEAEKSFLNAHEIWEKLGMDRGKGYTYFELAEIANQKKDSSCIDFYNKSIHFNSFFNNNYTLIQSYTGLGKYYASIDNQNKAADFFSKALQLGIKRNFKNILITPLDFFIQHSEFQSSIPYSPSEILNYRIDAGEANFKRTSAEELRISEAAEMVRVAKEKENRAIQQSDTLKKIMLLSGILIFSSILYFYMIFRKNKELKVYQNKIEQQYELIKQQAKQLSVNNEKLKTSNSLLEQNLTINSLELGHSKKVIQNIQEASKKKEVKDIDSILRTQVKDSYFKNGDS